MSTNNSSKGRPLSCPVDQWRNDAEMSNDRPRSVLAKQDGQSRHASASDEVEVNKAKVNPWIGSEVEPDANTANRKPFYHYPSNASTSQRHGAKIISESVGSRPQTEPGRMRQPFSEDAKALSRESFTKVPGPADTTKQEETEDWVVVEKSSETTTPCDPDDESNVLVPRPNDASACVNEPSSSEHGTRMVMANEIGSTFQVLPQINDRNEATEGHLAVPEKKDTKSKGVSICGMGTFAATVVKWKTRRNSLENAKRLGFKALDEEHRQILTSQSDTMKTEVPEGLMRTIKEEAYIIILKTTQVYRSQIGARHKLTSEAYEYLKELKDELQKS